MASPLFVVAPEADYKSINLLLLYLRDWEYSEEGDERDNFLLITKRDPTLQTATQSPSETAVTEPPIPADTVNDWRDASLEDVEQFCLAMDEQDETRDSVNYSFFLVLDAEGLRNQTVVLGGGATTTREARRIEHFNKTRIPWHRAYLDWANLSVGNLEFESLVIQDEGADENHWWVYDVNVDDEAFLSAENREARDVVVERMRDEGYA